MTVCETIVRGRGEFYSCKTIFGQFKADDVNVVVRRGDEKFSPVGRVLEIRAEIDLYRGTEPFCCSLLLLLLLLWLAIVVRGKR